MTCERVLLGTYIVLITAYCVFLAIGYQVHSGEIAYLKTEVERWRTHSSRLTAGGRALLNQMCARGITQCDTDDVTGVRWCWNTCSGEDMK